MTARDGRALFSWPARSSISLEASYFFARQLHLLHKSGVPLLSSLHALQSQLPAGPLKRLIREAHRELLEGRTFSQALARHPQAFSPVVIGLVRAGEAGGILDEVLEQLSQLFAWEMELRQRLREALQYPLLVLATLSAALIVVVTVVLPRFTQLFRSFRMELPLHARLLMGVSHVVSRYGWLVVLAGLAVALGCWASSRTPSGRLRWDRWRLTVPVLGLLAKQLLLARFARVLGALLRSGVPMLEALELAGESMNNRYVQQQLLRVRDRLREGEALASALKRDALFPPVVVQMVATGEETGRVDDMLQSITEYYHQQTTYEIKRLMTYVEPAILLLVGVGILWMAASVLVPMWDLVRVFKHTGG